MPAITALCRTDSLCAVGVTTIVDAGSSGWRNFPDFKDSVIDRSKTRVLALLNIVGSGMRGDKFEHQVEDMDAKATADMALKHKGVVVGIKTAHYRGPEWTPVERAVEAGTIAGISRSWSISARIIPLVRCRSC